MIHNTCVCVCLKLKDTKKDEKTLNHGILDPKKSPNKPGLPPC